MLFAKIAPWLRWHPARLGAESSKKAANIPPEHRTCPRWFQSERASKGKKNLLWLKGGIIQKAKKASQLPRRPAQCRELRSPPSPKLGNTLLLGAVIAPHKRVAPPLLSAQRKLSRYCPEGRDVTLPSWWKTYFPHLQSWLSAPWPTAGACCPQIVPRDSTVLPLMWPSRPSW